MTDAATDSSRFAAVSLLGRDGPHVTPVATVEAAGHRWFTTSRSSAKARLLARDDRISITVREPDRTRIITGRARVVDPARPAFGTLGLGARSPSAALALALRHLPDVFGYLTDWRSIPDDWSPRARVLVAVPLEHLTILPDDGAPDLAAFADERGAFAVPATYDGQTLVVSSTMLARRPDWSLGAAALVEGAPTDRPADQEGLLVRGSVDAVRRRCGQVTVDLSARSTVRWRGFATERTTFEGLLAG